MAVRHKIKRRTSERKPSIVMPTVEELQELVSFLSPSELAELDQLLAPRRDRIDWLPQPGPQTMAYYSKAQMLGYGGAAGGGKTDLLLGKAGTQFARSIIYRREYNQLKFIKERASEMFGDFGKYNSQDQAWRVYTPADVIPRKQIEFGAVQHLGDERKFQGRPHGLKGFDEVTHLFESQFDYLRGWLRSTNPLEEDWQIVATFNPPQLPQERWVLDVWGPWLDPKKFPNPAKPNELIWFIRVEDEWIIVDGPGIHTFKNKRRRAMSRTFIPSSVRDNMYLSGTVYEDVLDSLPEELRAALAEGDFITGIKDAPNQLIPTEWIKLAQKRWRERSEPTDIPVHQIGLDVSRGGKDRTVVVPRRENYICLPQITPGKIVTDGKKAAQAVMPFKHDRTLICVDSIGVGSSAFDYLKDLHDPNLVIAMVGGAASMQTDRSGFLGFVNQRSAWAWKLRESLDPQVSTDDLALPDTPEVLQELSALTWEPSIRGIKVHTKEEIMHNAGLRQSPDVGDAIIYAHAQPELPGRGVFEFYQSESSKLVVARDVRKKQEEEEARAAVVDGRDWDRINRRTQ